MLFWKRVKQKINGKWYPHTIVIGKTAGTQEVAERLARESTVSPADVHAVIRALPTVMAEIMAESRSVNLEGLGSFHFTAQATGKGVETEDKVSADQFTSVRVQFIPARQKQGTGYTRSLVGNVSFMEWKGPEPKPEQGGDSESPTRSDPADPDKERERQDPACLSLFIPRSLAHSSFSLSTR